MSSELFFLWDKIDKKTFYVEDHGEKIYKKDIDLEIEKLLLLIGKIEKYILI